MDKTSCDVSRSPGSGQECELWLRLQKAQQQNRYERQSRSAPASQKDNPWAGWQRYMSGRRAQEVREMSVEEYKNWPGRDE